MYSAVNLCEMVNERQKVLEMSRKERKESLQCWNERGAGNEKVRREFLEGFQRLLINSEKLVGKLQYATIWYSLHISTFTSTRAENPTGQSSKTENSDSTTDSCITNQLTNPERKIFYAVILNRGIALDLEGPLHACT